MEIAMFWLSSVLHSFLEGVWGDRFRENSLQFQGCGSDVWVVKLSSFSKPV